MLATRQGALILAVLCAAGAAAVLMFALSSYKSNVQTVTPQATVLVATGQIQKGTSGDLLAAEKLYRSMPILATQLVPGAIADSSQLAGRIAQSNILPGQQLTTAEFTTVAGASALLAPNQRAVSVPVDEIHGDLDVLAPGDHVDLYAELSQKGESSIALLVPDVLVLKTPASSVLGTVSTGAAAPAAGGALVVAVSTEAAPALNFTADQGKIWALLRPVNATKPQPGLTTFKSVITAAALGTYSAGSANANATTTPTVTHP